ncbi:MAG: NADH-quinone oxidoreductase subunit G [Actinobacteria bacterium]|nr:NADH-quinone oxidoreductase subunit G [Actinomycetota bacterium]
MTEQSTEVVDMITLVIDGFDVTVPKGTLVIRAAEKLGIMIPRFCDHPLLDPVGACRQCLVEIEINGRAFPKPQASCTIPVEPGMMVKTQLTSAVAEKAQRGVMEFLLINHPLDCPVCDKGGECPLQNQAMSTGQGESRYSGKKRTFEKPINISSQILLDRERCILCARCTRFSEQIAGDPFITMNERGALQQVGIYEKQPFESYFSGNTVQICPVGALTGASYRFRARPFDLVSTPSACEHCASGCSLRTDVRRGKTLRRLAGEDAQVNEEWNCDKGRWAFKYATSADRLTTPMIRDADGELRIASWPEAMAVVAAGLSGKKAGVLVGGRATLEDAYGYSKFARVVLGTNNIDFRSRVTSEEERSFLASKVVGSSVTYADIDRADSVLLVGFEPEEESPIVFLRLKKQVRKRGLKVTAIASKLSVGNAKLGSVFVSVAPGAEAAAIATQELTAKSLILVGERASESAGALSAVVALSDRTEAKIAWIPRRAGERGALEAGAIGNLLPGARSVADISARIDLAAAWDVEALPSEIGLSGEEIFAAANAGEIEALVIGGVDPLDAMAHHDSLTALKQAFVVSLEIRPSAVTKIADVVLPVAVVAEKSGSFINWEGRPRAFEAAVADSLQRSDLRILSMIADEMSRPIGLASVKAAAKEFASIGTWDGSKAEFTSVAPSALPALKEDEALLTSWRRLLDEGTLQEGEENLAGTARQPVAVISRKRALALGVVDGDAISVSTEQGTVVLPVLVEEIHDDALWLPRNSRGSHLLATLGVASGALVKVVKE